jgi:hypothetical protein
MVHVMGGSAFRRPASTPDLLERIDAMTEDFTPAMPENFVPDGPAATPADVDEDVVPVESPDDSGNADAAE